MEKNSFVNRFRMTSIAAIRSKLRRILDSSGTVSLVMLSLPNSKEEEISKK
jgi:hypothetical protein